MTRPGRSADPVEPLGPAGGRSLADNVAVGGPLDPAALRWLGAGLAEELRAARRSRRVHRELTPENVLVTADGPRLIMDSEPPAGQKRPTAAAEVQAFGALLAFAATGKRLAGSGPARSTGAREASSDSDSAAAVTATTPTVTTPTAIVVASIPEGLREIVTRCLAIDPSARPSFAELLILFDDSGPADQPSPRIPKQNPGEAAAKNSALKPTPRPAPRPAKSSGTQPYPTRRKFLLLGALGLTAGGIALGIDKMPGGDTKPTGGEAGPRPNAASGAELPTVARPGLIGGPLKDPLWTRSVLHGVDALTAAGGLVLAGGAGIAAYDGASGEPGWSVPVDASGTFSESRLPVDGGTVYALTPGGELDALSSTDATQLWSAPPPPRWVRAGLVGASPDAVVAWALSTPGGDGGPGLWAADPKAHRPTWNTPVAPFDGMPYFSAGAGLVVVSRPNNFQLAAYSVADGDLAWTAEDAVARSGGRDAAFATSVAGHGATVYWATNRLYALDQHGKHLWPAGVSEGGDDGMFHAVVADDTLVYAAAEVVLGTDTIVAYGAADGALRWRASWPKQFFTPSLECEMALGGGNLYVVDRFSQTLVALDAATGRTLWQFHEKTPAKNSDQYWHVAADSDHVYIGYGSTLRAFTAT
ncbi:hypothetical protein GCM10009839_13540 [Catenulispora yoronensis]|uniref:Pyrrolo-quinoline quinone repeat domain-containing protein n=1 Tax=Catenulispora yoronensis TaxID=450799 RepID=A0ABN2TSW6_9ACTN